MNSYRRQWFGNILSMQVIIVLVFMLICMFTPMEIIVDYVDQVGVDTLRAVDESMTESLHYAEQTLRFLAKNEALVENLNTYADLSIPSETYSLALVRLRWALLSANYNNPEISVIACITPHTVLTNLGVAVLPDPQNHVNSTLGELLAYDQFREYLTNNGKSDPANGCILLERVGENNYLAAMLEYRDLYSTAEKGIYARTAGGTMVLADGEGALNEYVLAQEETLFDSDSFGESRHGDNLLKNLHLINGKLYICSEYYVLESGTRYIWMQELTEALGKIGRSALQCAALCALGEVAMSFGLWWLTGRVLLPFVRLNEIPAHMAEGEDSVHRMNRMMGSLRKKRVIQRQVLGVYALTLVPLVVLLPVSVNLLGIAVSGEVQSAYIDSVRQTAGTLSKRLQLYQRQNRAVAIDESLRDLIAEKDEYSRAERDEMLESLFLGHGLYIREVVGGVLYDTNGEIIASSRAYDAAEQLSPSVLKELNGKYTFSSIRTEPYGSDGTVMTYVIRSARDDWSYSLYETMGYLMLESEPVMNFESAQDAESFYYLYSEDAWQFAETPSYMPFRKIMEGMCQSGMLDVSRDVDSRMVLLDSTLLKQEPYLPGFAESSRMLVVSAKVGSTGLVLVGATSMAPIDEVGRLLPMFLIFTLLVFGALMLLLGMFFTQKLVRRVRAVERYFESVGLTSYELPEEIDVNNEIGALAQSMHDSIVRINKLQQAVVEEQAQKNHMEVRKREAEVIALQSQMDSHLISNVFATMKLLLHEGEYRTLRSVIESTGNFLRSGLTHNEYDVTLDKELRHVEAYLEIQKIRFGDKLRVEWEDCSPALMDCRVPKYLLQPVLENAIKHGMRPRELLTIRIHIGCVKGDLFICVSNDGYGLSAEEVAQLNHRLERREMADHIGLSNVQERIALRYGSPYGLKLSSGEDGLTRVDILLPVNMSEVSEHV